MLSYSNKSKRQSTMNVQGFVLGKSRQRTAVLSKAGSGGTRPGLQLSSSFTANHNLKQNPRDVESDNSDVDTLPSGPEKELLKKLELVELQNMILVFHISWKVTQIFLMT